MTSRERVTLALNHEMADRVPIDLGSTTVSGISAAALDRLRKALKLEEKQVKVFHPFMVLGYVDDDVLKAINGDIIGLWSNYTTFGYKNEGWKPWKLQDGTGVLVGSGFTVSEDDEGNQYIYPQGDTSVPPCAKLPKGGFYFDILTRQEPIDENNMDGRKDFQEQFTILSDEVLTHFSNTANELFYNTDYAIIGSFPAAGLGDIAHVPGPGLKKTPGIRNVEDWYAAHILYPQYIKDIFDYQVEIALKNLELFKQAVGDKILAIQVSGTDFGSQRGELMSADMFREFYKPRYKKMNDWIHKNTSWKTFYHSCGSIINLLDEFVDMGADILNPVQCSATGMEPDFLKDKYGKNLVFWGGGVDTQKTLPFSTPEEVKQEVLERLAIFSKGGGYIFNPIHNIQPMTPVENILAMFDAVKEFNVKKSL
jgi:hypothetical protein